MHRRKRELAGIIFESLPALQTTLKSKGQEDEGFVCMECKQAQEASTLKRKNSVGE
jgi:23S rRNA C2498 (ribose-2'-O)-methylase RlmM